MVIFIYLFSSFLREKVTAQQVKNLKEQLKSQIEKFNVEKSNHHQTEDTLEGLLTIVTSLNEEKQHLESLKIQYQTSCDESEAKLFKIGTIYALDFVYLYTYIS